MDERRGSQTYKSERVMEMEGGQLGEGGRGEVFALAWQNLEVIKDSVQ